jgi:hypothetical protein
MSRARAVIPVALLLALLRPAGAAEPILSGPMDRVVSAGDCVAVVAGPDVRLLSGDGRPLRDLGPRSAHDGSPPGPPRAPQAEEILELRDVPEEVRDTPEAEDLVEDELTLRERRRPRDPGPARVDRPALVAAAGDELWAIAHQAVWQVTSTGHAVRRAGLIPALDHLAAAGGERLVVAAGAQLWRSSDGGASFVPFATADGPVRALAAAGPWIAWATDRRLHWRAARRAGSLGLPAPARDLRFCGQALLVLHDRGLIAVDAAGAPRPIAAPRAARLGCGRDGGWWLVGPGLLVSTDEGRRFTPAPGLPPLPIEDAAPAPGGAWVATRDGLFATSTGDGPPPGVLAGAAGMGAGPAWAALLPRVVVSASAEGAPPRRDLRAVAYADFPLDSPPGGYPVAPPRRMAQATAAAGPAPAPWPGPDPEAPCLARARTAAVALAMADPARARSYIRRAANAAWLPELRLRMDRRLGRSESLDLPVGSVTGPLGLDTVNDVRYEARATWDLSRLVFSPDEMAAEAQALRMADVRRDLEALVTRLYFERRRLTLGLEAEAGDEAAARSRHALRADELQAELEALSGGAFAHCLAERRP